MPDVFLSYNRDDQPVARRFAEGIERAGFSVWWDQALDAGEAYDEVTEKALLGAKAVVVLWSKKSVASRWVRAEATQADRNRTLVPVMIEACTRPIMFELTQTADLTQWNGDPGDKTWQSLLAGLRRMVDKAGDGAGVSPVPHATTRAAGSRFFVPVAAGAALLIAAGALWVFRTPLRAAFSRSPATAVTVAAPASLAVLPFANLSSDKEQEYFSDGLSEELLNQLAQVPELRVIGRTSSFAFKGRNEDLRRIGEMLGVNHILEGSVRKAGNRVRITAQLIDPADGSHLWSQTYERTLDDIFAIQDEIARTVAAELKLKLTGQELNAGGTRDVAAFDEFLAGRALLNSNDGASMAAAVPHLERAVALDASYVPARLWLIDAYTRVSLGESAQAAIAVRKQNATIDEVVKLLPDSPEASLALSYRAARERDLRNLESLLQRSLQIASGKGVRARLRYGQFLLGVGRPAQALRELDQVRRGDPLDVFARTQLVLAYEVAGDFARAATEVQQMLSLPGGSSSALLGTAVTSAQGQRDPAKLRKALEAFLAAEGNPESFAAQMQPLLDDPARARRKLHELADDPRFGSGVFGASGTAQWAAYLGDRELALRALNEFLDQNFSFETAAFVLWRPVFRDLRGEPGFKMLLQRTGLVDYWRATGNWGDFCKPVGKGDFECH